MILKFSMEHYVPVLKLYNVYINDDPEVTLTYIYFMTMSNLAKLDFALGPGIG